MQRHQRTVHEGRRDWICPVEGCRSVYGEADYGASQCDAHQKEGLEVSGGWLREGLYLNAGFGSGFKKWCTAGFGGSARTGAGAGERILN